MHGLDLTADLWGCAPESRMAVRTWPELRAVPIDVYVCNFGADNSRRARALMNGLVAALAPTSVQRHALERYRS